jgi:hypothetical protein
VFRLQIGYHKMIRDVAASSIFFLSSRSRIYVMRAGFFLSFFLTSICCLAQEINIKGILVNERDHSPVAYANIGILNTPVGTISNEDGTFELSIPGKFHEEQLLFAALGFERKSFMVKDLSKENKNTITLTEQPTLLKNLTVKSHRPQPTVTAEMGNQYSNEGSIYADSAAAGSAMALLIENKYPSYHPSLTVPYHIKNAKLKISHNTFDRFKIRIRFLSVDSVTGLPDKDLVNQNIIAASGMKKGWLKFDLEKYNIRIQRQSFFIVFEWLLEDEDRLILLEQYKEFRRQFPKNVTVDTLLVDGEKITFNSWHGFRAGTSFGSSSLKFSLDNYKCFYRNNSYGKWKRSSFILTARVTVANYE